MKKELLIELLEECNATGTNGELGGGGTSDAMLYLAVGQGRVVDTILELIDSKPDLEVVADDF